MSIKKHIPNTLTSCSLLSGCIATVMAFNGQYWWVVIFVIIAAIFDFSDGFAARLLKAYSPMGKELDSLSDMVSFGVAPSVMIFHFLNENVAAISRNSLVQEYLPYIAFLIAIFSALRLAKFNVDERQSDSFIGLNTPANALFWVSFCCALSGQDRFPSVMDIQPYISGGLVYIVIGAVIVFSTLLTAELPMFSLKVKSWGFKGNELRYFLALFMVAMLIFVGILGIAAGILLYIALSILDNRNKKLDSAA